MKRLLIFVLFATSVGAQGMNQNADISTVPVFEVMDASSPKPILTCDGEPIDKTTPWRIKVHGCKISDGHTLDEAMNVILDADATKTEYYEKREKLFYDSLAKISGDLKGGGKKK